MADKSNPKIVSVDKMESDSSPRSDKSKNQRPSIGKPSPDKSKSDDSPDESYHLELPPTLRRRVSALRKLQFQSIRIEKEFFQKVHELECEFAQRMAPLHEQRNKIVNGQHEPTDEECDFSVPYDEEHLANELQNQEAIKKDEDIVKNEEAGIKNPVPRDYYAKGIPEFWLTALRSSEFAGMQLEYPKDEVILKNYLTDIQVEISKDPMKFTLYFYFAPNEYFTNSVLTKEYTMKCEPYPEDPFSFEGSEIVTSKGCKIDWKDGMDTTLKEVTKVIVKKNGERRHVRKIVKANTFFNFFNPPVVPEGDQDDTMDEKLRAEFETDAEVGLFLRNTLIPRAVLYYTGEFKDNEDEYEEEEEDDGDYDEEDEEEEEDGENGHEGGQSKA